MKILLLYKNGNLVLKRDVNEYKDCIKYSIEYFGGKEKFDEIGKALSIRIYFVELKEKIKGSIIKVHNDGKVQKKETAVIWSFKGKYKDADIDLTLFDVGDFVYTFWDLLSILLNQDNKKTIENLKFSLSVKPKGGSLTQKQKVILFFSKDGNWGKIWKYSDLREAMKKDGLEMIGRGIEGERPREVRYMLGYPFITSEQDKKVPDGSCIVEYPFPTMPRNERRIPDVTLEKADWSELLEILNKTPKLVRCYSCGLFEGETNKIGQKTKFEKGHLMVLTMGGDASKQNIIGICKYCNSEQKNIFSYDKSTGKKIYHPIPFVKKLDYKSKVDILKYLLSYMKKEDVKKLVEAVLK